MNYAVWFYTIYIINCLSSGKKIDFEKILTDVEKGRMGVS